MTNKNLLFTLFSTIILISSCDEQLPEEEAKGYPITNPQFVFMRESNLLYFAGSYELVFEGDSLSSFLVEWYGQDGTNTDSIWLSDGGNFGDLISNDRLYSRKIPNDPDSIDNIIQPNLVGEVSYKFLGTYGVKKIELLQTTYVQNIPPVILSVTAPDTIYRPLGAELDFILITADIFDENGLDDISNCGFTTLHIEPDTLLNNGNQILMYDDGSTVEIFPDYYSGDEISDDGKFSVQIPIFGPENPSNQTKTGTFLWTFIARDNSSAISEPVEHIIVVE